MRLDRDWIITMASQTGLANRAARDTGTVATDRNAFDITAPLLKFTDFITDRVLTNFGDDLIKALRVRTGFEQGRRNDGSGFVTIFFETYGDAQKASEEIQSIPIHKKAPEIDYKKEYEKLLTVNSDLRAAVIGLVSDINESSERANNRLKAKQ